jgi:hypothetical protein
MENFVGSSISFIGGHVIWVELVLEALPTGTVLLK